MRKTQIAFFIHIATRNVIKVSLPLFTYYILFVLQFSPIQLGVILGMSYLCSALLSIIGGRLCDIKGGKTILIVISLLEGFVWLGLAFVHEPAFVMIAYALVSGFAYSRYTIYASFGAELSSSKLGTILGAVNTIDTLTAIIGVFLGALIAHRISFVTLFLLVSFFHVLSMPPLILIRSAIKSTEGGVNFNINQLHVEISQAFTIIKQVPVLRQLFLMLFILTLFTYAENFYPDFVKKRFGASPFEIGLFGVIPPTVWAISNYPLGILLDKVSKYKIVAMGYLTMAISWLFFPFAGDLITLYLLYLLFVIGNSAGYFLTAIVMNITKLKGTAVGLMNATITVASAITSIIGGFLWISLGANISFWMLSTAYALGAFFIYVATYRILRS